jgi:ABC-type cobalamin/Fe3+-siderophores transport system ATPase subunit
VIRKIAITNIKGIGDGTTNGMYEFDIPKNKPSILVAPNGFGKSSLATAFKSLKSSKIELHKDDFHQEIWGQTLGSDPVSFSVSF